MHIGQADSRPAAGHPADLVVEPVEMLDGQGAERSERPGSTPLPSVGSYTVVSSSVALENSSCSQSTSSTYRSRISRSLPAGGAPP